MPKACPALAEQDQVAQGFILLQVAGTMGIDWHGGTSGPCRRPLLEAPGLARVCRLWALGPVGFHFLLE